MANRNWGFCDLSVNKNFDRTKLHLLEKLGYNTVAINTHVEEISDEPRKKKRKGGPKEKKEDFPSPVEVPNDLDCKLNILQRVTIEFSDTVLAHQLNNSESIKKYDLIAVIPKTLQAFQYACGTLDIDIISFQPENRLPFKISRKLYRQAVERGICFELMYSPAIKDSTLRKNIINTAHYYHAVGKSKNIIVTSSAENYSQVRSTFDVINLGFILGLNSNESLEVIKNNTRRLIIKADGRKRGRHFMVVSSIENDGNKITEI